jgi:acetylornithine/succinyldiaminopimelate/putrescine aminotransferase
MMMGIKMKNELLCMYMVKACYESGLLCIYANNDPSVLQFLPPLIIKEYEAEEVIRRLDKALSMVSKIA